MRKYILSGLIAFAVLVGFGYGVAVSMDSNATAGLNAMAMLNLDALANGEVGGGGGDNSENPDGFVCQWATRETYSGWEGVCIRTGVGYVCTCGDVKQFENP